MKLTIHIEEDHLTTWDDLFPDLSLSATKPDGPCVPLHVSLKDGTIRAGGPANRWLSGPGADEYLDEVLNFLRRDLYVISADDADGNPYPTTAALYRDEVHYVVFSLLRRVGFH